MGEPTTSSAQDIDSRLDLGIRSYLLFLPSTSQSVISGTVHSHLTVTRSQPSQSRQLHLLRNQRSRLRQLAICITNTMAKGNILSLILLFLFVGVMCAVGFVVYSIATDVGHNTRKKMEKRNISFTKDGMKVGVKEKTAEQQTDDAQGLLVKVWNNSYFPAYKSRLGWMDGSNGNPGSPAGTPGADKRKPYARSSSSQTSVPRSSSSQNVSKA